MVTTTTIKQHHFSLRPTSHRFSASTSRVVTDARTSALSALRLRGVTNLPGEWVPAAPAQPMPDAAPGPGDIYGMHDRPH